MSPTRVLAGVAVVAALLLPSVPAQNHRRNIYSNPELPAPEALRRLNLHQAWRGTVPMEGRKDGFLRIVFDGRDMFVTTRSGLVMRLDAETGQVRWRSRVGKAYTLLPYITMNRRSLFVIANATLFSLDRETGTENFEFSLPGGITAGVAVDKTRAFVPTATTELYTYALPLTGGGGGGIAGSGNQSLLIERGDGQERLGPKAMWTSKTNIQLSYRPMVSKRELLVLSPEGQGIGFHKTPHQEGVAEVLFSFDLGHKVTTAPTSFGDTAYIGCDDSTLYSVNMRNGRLRWRHTAGTPITRSPVLLDTDLFFTSDRDGLTRLDRVTGEPRWRFPHARVPYEGNPNADQFLAANDRFVYATDDSGRLLVLDRKRGTQLSMFDSSAFRFPVINDVTDRLYLAANNGMIVCLHDRDQREPMQHRRSLEEAALQKQLDERITEGSSRDVPLQEALANLEDRYDLDFVLDADKFKEANVDSPLAKLVRPPTWDNRPLRDYLKQILNQAGATFTTEQEILRIVPMPARKKKDADEEEKPAEPAKKEPAKKEPAKKEPANKDKKDANDKKEPDDK
jgi:outer membrane protein assembly factor BamB